MVDFDDKLFWIGQRWPADAYGYVFLARALTQLGKALFPSEWTGAEMVAEAPYPRDGLYIDGAEGNVPKPHFWSEPQLFDVLARVLRENHPDIEIRYTPGHSRRPVLTDEQHMAALLTIERVNPIRIAALARMAKVTQTLGHALRDGKIKFALLPTRGGEFIPDTKPSWWNIPSMAHRWKRCQLSPADPYSVAIAGTGFMHIFVDGSDLATFLATHRPAAPASAVPPQPSNNEAYATALALLSSWTEPNRTIRGFQSHCKAHGISSTIAREAYGTLGAAKGRKPA